MGGGQTYCYICGAPLTTLGQIIDPKITKKLFEIINSIIKKQKPRLQKNLKRDFTRGNSYLIPELMIKDLKTYFPDPNHEYYDIIQTLIKIIEKHTLELGYIKKYQWLEKLILLHKSGKNIPVFTEDSWQGEFKDSNGTIYYSVNAFLKHYDGIVMHKDCYTLKSNKFGKFNYDNLNPKKTINHNIANNYQEQDIDWDKIFYNSHDFILESPLKNTKNKKRVESIKLYFTGSIHKKSNKELNKNKNTAKSSKSREGRPSPPFSAKDYPNKKKKGGDGKIWISIPDKNGVYKWKRVN